MNRIENGNRLIVAYWLFGLSNDQDNVNSQRIEFGKVILTQALNANRLPYADR